MPGYAYNHGADMAVPDCYMKVLSMGNNKICHCGESYANECPTCTEVYEQELEEPNMKWYLYQCQECRDQNTMTDQTKMYGVTVAT